MLGVVYSMKTSSALVARTANTIRVKRAAGLVLISVAVNIINLRFVPFS
jgi:hypothetical protein